MLHEDLEQVGGVTVGGLAGCAARTRFFGADVFFREEWLGGRGADTHILDHATLGIRTRFLGVRLGHLIVMVIR